MRKYLCHLIIAMFLSACGHNEWRFDASGIFEAEEVIVSAEIGGKLLRFSVKEGQALKVGQLIGRVDCDDMNLQKQQVLASIEALRKKQNEAEPQVQILQEQLKAQEKQVATLREQLSVMEREERRLKRLVEAKAAPTKQLDDIQGEIAVLQKRIESAESQQQVVRQQVKSQQRSVALQNRGILSEEEPLKVQVAQLEDRLEKCKIENPLDGTVLVKYAEENEMASPGKALYKIAALDTLTLRAYITGQQLPEIRLNQSVQVMVDNGEDGYREYAGRIAWIADKAEFTPKSVQTKEQRANLVYAVKIEVPNDGFIKIGMYGEVLLNEGNE